MFPSERAIGAAVCAGALLLPLTASAGKPSEPAETGVAPAFNGVEQDVLSPSGNVTTIVHNEDVPVLLFDVTGIDTEDEFFARCAEGGVQPFAEGSGAAADHPRDCEGFQCEGEVAR